MVTAEPRKHIDLEVNLTSYLVHVEEASKSPSKAYSFDQPVGVVGPVMNKWMNIDRVNRCREFYQRIR